MLHLSKGRAVDLGRPPVPGLGPHLRRVVLGGRLLPVAGFRVRECSLTAG